MGGVIKRIVNTKLLSHHSWYIECRMHAQTLVCILIVFPVSEQSGQIYVLVGG